MAQTRKKILIVDDEPDMHALLKVRLEQDGYDVLGAYRGAEVINIVKKERPDAVIVDVVMPGMTGFDVCQQVKKENPATKVIIYTAKVEGVDAGRAKEVGADLFTVKTNSLVLLMASIKRVLENEEKK